MRLANLRQRLRLVDIQLQRQALLDESKVLDLLDEVSYKAILARMMLLDQETAPHWIAALNTVWNGSPRV